MKLLRAAGIRPEIPADLPEEAAELLAAAALAFLQAGGVVTLTDWADLTDHERVALEAAGRALAAERAVRAGVALQGPAGQAAALAPADGGTAMRQVLVAAAAAGAAGQAIGAVIL